MTENQENQVIENNIQQDKQSFDMDLIYNYPKAGKRMKISVEAYDINFGAGEKKIDPSQTTFISPHGLEFHGTSMYAEGELLKIDIPIPNYWKRKQKLVSYTRIDTPNTFQILAKVVKSENVGKRSKKKKTIAQLVNIEEYDEEVLKSYLKES